MIQLNSFCDTVNRIRSFCDESIEITMPRSELIGILEESNLSVNLTVKLLPVEIEHISKNTIGLDVFYTLLKEVLVSQSDYILKHCEYRTITQYEINILIPTKNKLVLSSNSYIVKNGFLKSIELLQTKTLLFTDTKV